MRSRLHEAGFGELREAVDPKRRRPPCLRALTHTHTHTPTQPNPPKLTTHTGGHQINGARD